MFVRYSFEHSVISGIPVIILKDLESDLSVSVAPSLGNRAVRIERNNMNFLHWQPNEFSGIPFMAPWANRMSAEGFWSGPTFHPFKAPAALQRDSNNLAIHGLLTSSTNWQVERLACGNESAALTCRLDYHSDAQLRSNWPLKHSYEMTYRLGSGAIEVEVAITNGDSSAMPVAVGFHPYFQIPGVPRKEVALHVAARKRVVTDERLLATGAFEPVTLPNRVSLAAYKPDDGFTDLVRDSDGISRFWAEGGRWRLELGLGPRYPVAIVYAPPNHEYICIEPMSAITDGINLAAVGLYPELQWIQAGETWRDSFWISIFRRWDSG